MSEKKNEKKQTGAQRVEGGDKKCCCLAGKDITSDTDVKLASSGTIGPLFTRRRGVSVWLSPTPLHP